MDTVERLSKITIILHWVVALLIIGLLGFGFYMTNFSKWEYYPLHKSIGILLFGFVIFRVLWRYKNGWPKPVAKYQEWEVSMAKIVHWVLIISTVLMPVWGIMNSTSNGHGFGLFGLVIIGPNYDPANANEVLVVSERMGAIGKQAHEYTAYVLIAAIVLHVAGALKHHLIDKDSTLQRMLGRS